MSKDVTAVCRVRDDDSFISSRVEMVGESVDVETGGCGQRVHLDGVADNCGNPKILQHCRFHCGKASTEDRSNGDGDAVAQSLVPGKPGVLRDEQRVAAGSFRQGSRLRVVERVPGDAPCECCNLALRERRHNHGSVSFAVEYGFFELAHCRPDFQVSERRHEPDSGTGHCADQVGQATKGRGIGPLNVVDDDGQQCIFRRSFDGGANPFVDGKSRFVRIDVRRRRQYEIGVGSEFPNQSADRPPRRRSVVLRATCPDGGSSNGRCSRRTLLGESCLADAAGPVKINQRGEPRRTSSSILSATIV